MKRSLFVLLILGLFAVACSSNSTVDTIAVSDALDDTTNDASTNDASNDDDTNDDDTNDDDTNDDDTNDDDTNDDDTNDDDLAETDAPGPTPTAEQPADPDPPTSGVLGSDDWCTVARQVESQFDEVDVLQFAEPAALEEAYTKVINLIRQSQAIAPREIAPAVATSLAGLEVLAAALAAAGWSFLDLDLAALEGLAGEQEQATFEIEKYNFEVCGIDGGFDPADDPNLQPDTPDDDEISIDGTIRDQVRAGLMDSLGATAEEAECAIDKIDLTNVEALATDPSAVFPALIECGIALPN